MGYLSATSPWSQTLIFNNIHFLAISTLNNTTHTHITHKKSRLAKVPVGVAVVVPGVVVAGVVVDGVQSHEALCK